MAGNSQVCVVQNAITLQCHYQRGFNDANLSVLFKSQQTLCQDETVNPTYVNRAWRNSAAGKTFGHRDSAQ